MFFSYLGVVQFFKNLSSKKIEIRIVTFINNLTSIYLDFINIDKN